jgi:hypothetical protein
MGAERGSHGSNWKACEILLGKPEGKYIFENILLGWVHTCNVTAYRNTVS